MLFGLLYLRRLDAAGINLRRVNRQQAVTWKREQGVMAWGHSEFV